MAVNWHIEDMRLLHVGLFPDVQSISALYALSSKSSIISTNNLSLKGSHQSWVRLDDAWVLLCNELDGSDNLGTGLVFELLGWLAKDSCEDGDELWGERDDGCVLVLVCGNSLADGTWNVEF